MDYAKALTFITEDPRWKEKIAIGGGVALATILLSPILIGIIGALILAGYSLRLTQNVRDGDPYPLPEWDAWGEDLVRGFKLAVVGVVWALPAIVFMIPVSIVSAFADGRGSAANAAGLIAFCGTCLVSLYSLFIAFLTPGFTIAFATDEHISSGLQFTKIWGWTQKNLGQVVIAMLVVIVASIAIALVGSIVGALLCLIGLIITLPLIILLTSIYQYHIYGQLARTFPYDGPRRDAGPVTPPADWTPEQHNELVTPPIPPTTPNVPFAETPDPEIREDDQTPPLV